MRKSNRPNRRAKKPSIKAPEPSKPASFMGIPVELRSQILEYCLPSEDSVNLSRLPPLSSRSYWKYGTRRRYDPSVLSVSKCLYEEASDLLYRRNFTIEVNCGLYPHDRAVRYDPKWRGTKLTGRFPFHKGKQITVQVDAHLCCNPDHVFHHMVYVCGLLLSDSKTVKNLRVEVWDGDAHGRVLKPDCQSWQETGNLGFANHFGLNKYSSPEDVFDEHLAFLLQPLALGGRVQQCEIALCDQPEPSEGLQATIQHYKNALTGKTSTGSEDTRWIWHEYMSILVKQEQCARRHQQAKLQLHQEWLRSTDQEQSDRHLKKRNDCKNGKSWGRTRKTWVWVEMKTKQPALETARLLKEGEQFGLDREELMPGVQDIEISERTIDQILVDMERESHPGHHAWKCYTKWKMEDDESEIPPMMNIFRLGVIFKAANCRLSRPDQPWDLELELLPDPNYRPA
ncbi:MAG: hypothetical protein L6R38_001161 [Xanthoria sp. 2 TBL-2021]|nr:MAG: hypothetical protein L6R38_001161 [Xanthoria sp. 2 TBL-2021]